MLWSWQGRFAFKQRQVEGADDMDDSWILRMKSDAIVTLALVADYASSAPEFTRDDFNGVFGFERKTAPPRATAKYRTQSHWHTEENERTAKAAE